MLLNNSYNISSLKKPIIFKHIRFSWINRFNYSIKVKKSIHRKYPKATISDENKDKSISTKKIDFEEITDIIKMVNESDVVEFELKQKGFNIELRKKEALTKSTPPPTLISPQTLSPLASPLAPLTTPQISKSTTASPVMSESSDMSSKKTIENNNGSSNEGVQILSPMSGTFYSSPAPGEPVFIKEGDFVSKGDTVCIIEAMKLMNEIEAESNGKIIKIHAQNGDSVSPGQPLITLA